MKIGTKSVLFGVHQFAIHPWFVAAGWWQLFGFPWDPRLWVAFFVHDLGYMGKPNMDGEEGEEHVFLGARLMFWLFDRKGSYRWWNFCLHHSRYVCKNLGGIPSRLCYADKMAFVLTPWWLYRLLAYASGEIHEYMYLRDNGGKYADMQVVTQDPREWFLSGQLWVLQWINNNMNGVKND